MEQGKNKYEVAVEILNAFDVQGMALEKFGKMSVNAKNEKCYKLPDIEAKEKALEYYLKHLARTMSALNS